MAGLQQPLPPGQQLVASDRWPLVGERVPAAHDGTWSASVAGLVECPQAFSLQALQNLPQVTRAVDIHCVTRWSKPAVVFGGVRLADLLDLAGPRPQARYVSFVARSNRGHSTSIVLTDALELDALVALRVGSEALPVEHGGPVRIVVPGRYFYKSLKWLARIELLAADRLGYWESTAGYHNRADPSREERYIAPEIGKREARELLDRRDVSDRHLRSIRCAGLDLHGLTAERATLRDADFQRCRLRGARFDGANLSNARFQRADLRDAQFEGADVEGADFSGADLRGADFRGALLMAASFITAADDIGTPPLQAVIDGTTQFDAAALDDLTPAQVAFVHRCGPGLGGPDPA